MAKENKTVWFVNKKTGVKWEISNPDMIARLKKNVDYEVTANRKTKE